MTHSLSSDARTLLSPPRLFTLHQINADPTLVPKSAGIYGWWFSTAPPGVPLVGAVVHNGARLLYVGIAPREPASNGQASKKTIRDRLKNHCRGPIASSTLRRTLVCLLRNALDFDIQRRQSGKLFMSKSDEERLTSWMDNSARVGWSTHNEPWKIEKELIACDHISLPLNIGGAKHPFAETLKQLRASIGST
jgi:hypothetical protein